MGAAHVSDLEDIADATQKGRAELAALRLGEALVLNASSIASFEGVMQAYADATR